MPTPARLRSLIARWGGALALWAAAWLLLSTMLYLLLANETRATPDLGNVLKGQGARVLLWMPLAFGVQWLWRRFPFGRSQGYRHLGLHLAACAGCVLFNYLVRVAIFTGIGSLPGLFSRPWLDLSATNLWDVIVYGAIIAYTALRDSRERELEGLRHQAELQSSMAAAELRALKYQLQPHFLYNALNAVVALIQNERHAEATATLATLGAVLRALTDGPSQEFVPLEDEFAFLEKLLSIEKVRFGDKLAYEFDSPPELRRARVPSFILQPLIENAVKHGISRRIEPGRILVRARSAVGGRLLLEVQNDLPPPPAQPAVAGMQLIGGVGLSATRSRLRHLYGEEGSFRCDLFNCPRATVAVEIPLAQQPEPAPAP